MWTLPGAVEERADSAHVTAKPSTRGSNLSRNVNSINEPRDRPRWPRKSRTVAVRLISMAMTGYYRTMIRPRVHRPLSMMKYDPVVKKQVLFLEATKGGKNK
ncbi:unnamed protein product [Penicillium olsonii]|nr:unnamed protein product [Penicillium olsonii]CAG7917279.1 unnamed protein product [Penicillium olsonii]